LTECKDERSISMNVNSTLGCTSCTSEISVLAAETLRPVK
jgi:hypothetical protein